MNKEVRRVIEAWSSNRKNDLVFYNIETGKSFVDLKAGFGLACEKAGITGVTWRTLRHTFASRLIERGVDIVTVSAVAGAFDGHRNHSLYAPKSRVKKGGNGPAFEFPSQIGHSLRQKAATGSTCHKFGC